MSGPNDWSWVSSALAFVLGIFTASMAAIWKLRDYMTGVEVKIQEVQDAQITGDGNTERNIGESLAALRQKIAEVELWNRDNFVRREDFQTAVGQIQQNMNSGFERIERKLERLAETPNSRV